MKTTLIALIAGSALLATTLVPAFAARKACQPGTFWSAKSRACVDAGSQAKPQKMCLGYNSDGGLTSLPCSQL